MKNKKILALLMMTVVFSTAMTACNFGGDEADQIVVETTPTPKPTKAPEPTPTPVPANVQSSTYTSKDKSVSISLPDATWANKTDETDMLSFESPDQGKLLVLHGQGDEAMSVAVIPTTPDTAVALEQAADLVQGEDFIIHDFTSTDVNGIGVYTYYVEYLNEKSGYAYVVKKYIANEDEFYDISGSVKQVKNTEKLLKKMKKTVNSFTITGDSSLKSAAPKKTESDKNTQASSGEETQDSGENTGESSGENTVNISADEAALSDTNQTRTIYNNDDGSALVIYSDGNGNWSDEYGNTYDFVNDEDVYDQDGVDYYYHGEAADVYYMPVE